MFQQPTVLPSSELSAGISAMMMIIAEAEAAFGRRDGQYAINQSIAYGDHSPRATGMEINGKKICFICLSSDSLIGWPCFMFEMAHEAVHALNPRNGPASYLEEGIAVWFSQEMCKKHGYKYNAATGKYKKALELIKKIPEEPTEAVKIVRSRHANLTDITPAELIECFPTIDPLVAQRLANKMA